MIENRKIPLRILGFSRDWAREKWPLRGSPLTPSLSPEPGGEGWGEGERQRRVGHSIITPAKRGIGISLALSAYHEQCLFHTMTAPIVMMMAAANMMVIIITTARRRYGQK